MAALHAAILSGSTKDVADALRPHGTKLSTKYLNEAVLSNSQDMLKFLAERVLSGDHGIKRIPESVLCCAIKHGNSEAVDFLLNGGGKCAATCWTLNTATQMQDEGLVRRLIDVFHLTPSEHTFHIAMEAACAQETPTLSGILELLLDAWLRAVGTLRGAGAFFKIPRAVAGEQLEVSKLLAARIIQKVGTLHVACIVVDAYNAGCFEVCDHLLDLYPETSFPLQYAGKRRMKFDYQELQPFIEHSVHPVSNLWSSNRHLKTLRRMRSIGFHDDYKLRKLIGRFDTGTLQYLINPCDGTPPVALDPVLEKLRYVESVNDVIRLLQIPDGHVSPTAPFSALVKRGLDNVAVVIKEAVRVSNFRIDQLDADVVRVLMRSRIFVRTRLCLILRRFFVMHSVFWYWHGRAAEKSAAPGGAGRKRDLDDFEEFLGAVGDVACLASKMPRAE